MEGNVAAILIILLLFIGLFFAFREIMCWYYKINAMLDETRKTNALLQRLLEVQIKGNRQDVQGNAQGTYNTLNYREEDVPKL